MKQEEVKKIMIRTIKLLEKRENKKAFLLLDNIVKSYSDSEETLLTVIEKHLYELSRWKKIILLLSGKLGEKSASMIKMLLKHDDDRLFSESVNKPDNNKSLFRDLLLLAVQCQAESKCYDKTITGIITERFKKIFTEENFFIQRSVIIALMSELSDYSEEILKILLFYILSKDKNMGHRGNHDRVEEIFKKAEKPLPDFILKVFKEETSSLLKYNSIKALLQLYKNDRYSPLYNMTDFLEKIGEKDGENFLFRALSDENNLIRNNAAKVLGIIKSKKAVEALLLSMNDSHTQINAIEALGNIGDKKAVEVLISSLKKGNNSLMRTYAAEALGKIADERAVDPLISALEDEDRSVRINAAEALGRIGNEKAMEPLIMACEDKDYSVQEKAVKALGRIGNSVIDALILLLNNKNSSLRYCGAIALGYIKNKRAIEPLISALNDEDISVRRASIASLVMMQDKKTAEYLIPFLKDDDCLIRKNTIYALEHIESKRAVELLIPLLKDKEYEVRKAAVEILGQIGGKKVIKFLISLLKDDVYKVQNITRDTLLKTGKANIKVLIPAIRHKDSSIRKEIINILIEIGDKKALKPLIKALDNNSYSVQRKIVEFVKKLGGVKFIKPLTLALNDYDMGIQKNITNTVKIIGGKKALEPLIEALKADSELTRFNAIKFLGEIKDKRSVKPLITTTLEDENGNLREATKEALEKIGQPAVESLIPLLKNEEGLLRYYGVKILEGIGGKEATESLVSMLKDENDSVRTVAVEALKKIGKPAVKFLIPALKDEKVSFRMDVIEILSYTGGKRIVEHLIPVLKDENSQIKCMAVKALGLIKDKRSVLPLISTFIEDEDYTVKEQAVRVLTRREDKRIVEILKSKLKDKDSLMNPVEIFKIIEEKLIIEPFVLALENLELRTYVVKTIAKIRKSNMEESEWENKHIEDIFKELGEEAIEVWTQILENTEYSWMRSNMVEHLGLVKDKRVVKPLLKALKDPDWLVRLSAVKVLENIEIIEDERILEFLINVITGEENALVLERALEALKNKIKKLSKKEKILNPLKKPERIYISTKKLTEEKPRLLVVDDEADILEIFEAIYKKQYVVKTALNGRIALDIVLKEKKSFHLIITGLRMPVMGGLEFIRKLFLEFHINVPVITMTGYATYSSSIEALNLGVFDYLIKPFNSIDAINIVFEKARRIY